MNGSAIKLLIATVGGYFLYEYLKSSGLWGEWFGFPDTAALATYCGANPTGTASYNGQSATCAQWLQAIQQAHATSAVSSGTPAVTTPASTSSTPPATAAPPAIDQHLADQLTAGLQAQVGRPTGTISEWNWVLQNKLQGQTAKIITSSTQYGDQQITATQYLQQRAALGLAGLGYPQVASAWNQRFVF